MRTTAQDWELYGESMFMPNNGRSTRLQWDRPGAHDLKYIAAAIMSFAFLVFTLFADLDGNWINPGAFLEGTSARIETFITHTPAPSTPSPRAN